MRAIDLDHFEEHVRLMHEDRDKGFELEYQVSGSPPLSLQPLTVCLSSHSAFSQRLLTRSPRMPGTRTRTDLPTYSPVSSSLSLSPSPSAVSGVFCR